MHKKMMSKRFVSIVAAIVLAVALVIPAVVVSADTATATRTLPAAAVDPGANFNVGIVAAGCGGMGQVVETLPAGFSYVSCDSEDVIVTPTDNTVKFAFMGDGANFNYTVTASATEGPYSFDGIVKDENTNSYPVVGDTDITVGPTGPVEVSLEYSGSLTEDARVELAVIPGGATELEITLTSATDMDVELWDGSTHVIGWKAAIDSKGPTTDTYEGDTFTYSGWHGGSEYINADAVSQAYTLKVFGFEAGTYNVTVSYMSPVGVDVTPPVLTITAPDATVGNPTTITVSGVDPSDVKGIAFMVFCPFPPEGWEAASAPLQFEEIPPEMKGAAGGFGEEIILTFTPDEAGTYTVTAWGCDMLNNYNWEDPYWVEFEVE